MSMSMNLNVVGVGDGQQAAGNRRQAMSKIEQG